MKFPFVRRRTLEAEIGHVRNLLDATEDEVRSLEAKLTREQNARQRALDELQQVRIEVEKKADSFMDSYLTVDEESRGLGSLFRVMVTLDKHYMDEAFRWGDSEHTLRYVADYVANNLYQELRQMNHHRLKDGHQLYLTGPHAGEIWGGGMRFA